MKTTRRKFLKSVMLAMGAATVPLTATAAVNPTLPRSYMDRLYRGRAAGKSRAHVLFALGRVAQGHNVALFTQEIDFTHGMARALAQTEFGLDMHTRSTHLDLYGAFPTVERRELTFTPRQYLKFWKHKKLGRLALVTHTFPQAKTDGRR